jgi:hypothetical protein
MSKSFNTYRTRSGRSVVRPTRYVDEFRPESYYGEDLKDPEYGVEVLKDEIREERFQDQDPDWEPANEETESDNDEEIESEVDEDDISDIDEEEPEDDVLPDEEVEEEKRREFWRNYWRQKRQKEKPSQGRDIRERLNRVPIGDVETRLYYKPPYTTKTNTEFDATCGIPSKILVHGNIFKLRNSSTNVIKNKTYIMDDVANPSKLVAIELHIRHKKETQIYIYMM